MPTLSGTRYLLNRNINVYLYKDVYMNIDNGLFTWAQNWRQLKCPSAGHNWGISLSSKMPWLGSKNEWIAGMYSKSLFWMKEARLSKTHSVWLHASVS